MLIKDCTNAHDSYAIVCFVDVNKEVDSFFSLCFMYIVCDFL